MKVIWLVTHGETTLQDEKGRWIGDPGMNDQGKDRVFRLRKTLTEKLHGQYPPEVHCGTGRRQSEVAIALGFFKKPSKVFYSSLWGEAATLANVNGERKVLLSHDELIPLSQYITAEHVAEAIRKVVVSLPDNTVICSGRPVLIRLGMSLEEAKSGALYAIRVEGENISVTLEAGGVSLKA